jgi:hypothetical protein
LEIIAQNDWTLSMMLESNPKGGEEGCSPDAFDHNDSIKFLQLVSPVTFWLQLGNAGVADA